MGRIVILQWLPSKVFDSFLSFFSFILGEANPFMTIIKKLSSDEFTCEMCSKSIFYAPRYVYETFDFAPKNPSRELIVCKKCAIREHGSKHKKYFDEIFK